MASSRWLLIVTFGLLFGATGSLCAGFPKALIYDPAKAKAYAAKWCAEGNDCPDGQIRDALNTDCTHFIAHALFAGGVTVEGEGDAKCAKGLCKRVKDLEAWFSEAATKSVNVKRIDWRLARDGDFVFLQGFRWRDFEIGVKHVMMVGGEVSQSGSLVYGHTNERCGNEIISYDVASAIFYRIDESPYNGEWQSTDVDHRFSLSIKGRDVTFKEIAKAPPASIERRLILEDDESGGVRLKRSIDDAVLKFLDFPNPVLRSAILSRNPAPSLLILAPKAGMLSGEWKGLQVRKKPDGSFNEIVPPQQVPTKPYDFARK